MDTTIRVKQRKSGFGRKASHRACLRGLGLKRVGQVVELRATPSVLGMVRKVAYLLDVEEISGCS